MQRSQRKDRARRLEIEAKRRRHEADRAAQARRVADAAAMQAHAAEFRVRLATASDFHRRLEAAMKVTEEFAWKPWGYETPPLQAVPGLTVRHLRVVDPPPPVDVRREPLAWARDRFRTLAVAI